MLPGEGYARGAKIVTGVAGRGSVRRYGGWGMTRRSLGIAVASLATHTAVLVTLAILPPAELRTSSGLVYAPIDLIELTTVTAPPVAQPNSTQPPSSEPPPPATTEPTPAPRASARETKARADPTPPATAPSPAPPGPTPPPAESISDPSTPPRLEIDGLRGRTASVAGKTSPRLSDETRRRMIGPSGPAAPSATDGSGGTGGSGKDDTFVRNKKGELVYTPPGGQFFAKLLPDGRVHFSDRMFSTGGGVHAPDLYSLVSKAQKKELWAREKSQFLKRTFEFRLAIAVAFAETQIDRRIKQLYRDLVEIWSEDARPAVARRKTIFKRWDECEETLKIALPGFEGAEDSRIDKLRHSAGEKARAQIVAFVRRHAPRDSADAYSTAELEALNRGRRSKQKFAPYDETN